MSAAFLHVPVSAEAAARALEDHRDYRVLRRIGPMRRHMAGGIRHGMIVGCALDVETTGLDWERDTVIELAVQTFVADEAGRIIATGEPRSWLEASDRSLSPEVSRLTGLTDADIRGRRIADGEAASMLCDAHFIVAHNAGFDRPFVERRLPLAAGRPWVCSLRDVDWASLGFEGRSLTQLLSSAGGFYEAHRASSDVDALLHLLDHDLPDERTVLGHAVARATKPSWSIDAVGAPYAAKDLLKARGYRWDARAQLWSKEVPEADLKEETSWASIEVYGGMAAPATTKIDWSSRYGARVRTQATGRGRGSR